MAAKKEKKILVYKDKPLVRHEKYLYYGNPADKYIISFTLDNFKKVGDVDVAGKVIVQLQYNDVYLNPKNKPIKRCERENLWSAIDIGEFWLQDALEQG